MIVNLDKVLEVMRMLVCNNGGGYFNYLLFWEILLFNFEEKGGVIDDIKVQWGILDEFKNEFVNKVIILFGLGWIWLVVNDGKLEIVIMLN